MKRLPNIALENTDTLADDIIGADRIDLAEKI